MRFENLLLITEGMIIIRIKIVNEVPGLFVGNVVDSVIFEEFHNFLCTNEFIPGLSVKALERYIWPAYKGALILVKLCESLSQLLAFKLPTSHL